MIEARDLVEYHEDDALDIIGVGVDSVEAVRLHSFHRLPLCYGKSGGIASLLCQLNIIFRSAKGKTVEFRSLAARALRHFRNFFENLRSARVFASVPEGVLVVSILPTCIDLEQWAF